MPAVILPVLDEAAGLEWLLPRMPPGYRAVVVDNGSIDGSPAVAARHGALVVHESRRGFGAACFAGLTVAASGLESFADGIVCFMDADASLDPTDLPAVALPVANGDADLVLGRRVPERGAWPFHARLANRALAWEIGRRTRTRLHDLGPMRAARTAALVGLELHDRRFGWPLEMVLRARAAGWRVREVDVAYRARRGRSKVSGTVRGTARTVRDMAGVLRSQRP
ncbi:MAG: glycosyltransferase family 2 protein [Acidimicrobiales bacterium]